jgi:hypothetical protein
MLFNSFEFLTFLTVVLRHGGGGLDAVAVIIGVP